jgi:hypothetical protein
MKSSIHQLILISVILFGSMAPGWAAKPYKIYVINRYGAWDIVCDAYTVQKDDHIWDILRRKGSIAEEDFPRFVTILKGLNPGIKDVNKIYPSQKILVPLKQVEAKERPAESSPRYITIPMIPDILYEAHQVHSGEYLSRIVTAHLGVRWDEIPKDYFQTFRRLNPRIKNMDLIYPDQIIRIPALASTEPPAAQPGPVASEVAMADEAATSEKAIATAIPQALPAPVSVETPVPEQGTPSWQEGLAEAMRQLGSKLLVSGQCYFPEKDRGDVTLDLAAFPVIELQDGRHLLLETGKGLPKDIEEAARASWKDLVILRPDSGDPYDVVLDKVFRAMVGEKVQKVINLPAFDDGIQVTLRGDWILPLEARQGNQGAYRCITLIETPEESTSGPVVQYLAEANIQVLDIVSPAGKEKAAPSSKEKVLKDCPVVSIDGSSQEAFVSGFVSALGYSYDPRVPLSFDYAGFQVQTTANLIYGGRLADLVVDFGTFYGEAKSAVEAGGLRVLSIKPDEDYVTIAKQILAFTGTAYTEGPLFLAANRERSKASSLTIPGILISGVNEKRTLLTQVRLHTRLCDFLREKKIQPVQMRLVIE